MIRCASLSSRVVSPRKPTGRARATFARAQCFSTASGRTPICSHMRTASLCWPREARRYKRFGTCISSKLAGIPIHGVRTAFSTRIKRATCRNRVGSYVSMNVLPNSAACNRAVWVSTCHSYVAASMHVSTADVNSCWIVRTASYAWGRCR